MRRLLAVLAVAAVAVAPASARPLAATPLQRKLARALVVPHVAPARSSALAVDLATGHVLFSQNPTLPLAPASNEKLTVAYTALSLLGPTFHIPTYVLGEGQLVDGVWQGNLVLKGHGDPTLSSPGLQRLATQLETRGITEVTGDIVGDESWFDSVRTGTGWKPSFYLNESPPLSGLVVDGDMLHGNLARNPPLAAAERFEQTLKADGMLVDGTYSTRAASPTAVALAGIASVPLVTIIRRMDLESNNFIAELLLKQLGATQLGHGTSAAGAQVVMKTLRSAQIPTDGVRIIDGSGLSQLDRLTTQTIVALLESAWASPTLRTPLVGSLPVAGESGTLQDRMRRPPALGHVEAKTGTTDLASALSGYAKGQYVFSVLQNGSPIPYWWARIAQDRFAAVLAAQ